jgi:hypothetical protein
VNKVLTVLFAALAFGCGGSPSGAPPHGGGENKGSAGAHGTADDESIGEAARAQGGFSVLGGSGDGPQAPSTLGPPLMARLVLDDAKVKVDGLLREWPKLSHAKLETGHSKARASFAIQYDDARLYVAGEVDAPAFVRTDKLADTEDHARLAIAFPSASGLVLHEIGLFAGKAGETAGVVRFVGGPRRGEPAAGAKIVEAPHKGAGYTFEAAIPWSAFGETGIHMGLRGALAYVTEGGKASVATGTFGSARALPQLLTEPEIAVLEGLLEPKGLGESAPLFDLLADVAGDTSKERVAVYGHFLTVCGPKYRDGKQFFFRDLGGDIVGVEARAVTGRGKDDLVVRRRIAVEGTSREVLEVWSFRGDEPEVAFGQEIAVTKGDKRVSNAARIGKGEIEVSVDKASGWDFGSYREATLNDAEPILLPWGTVRSRTYKLEAGKFVRGKEITQAGAAAVAPPAATREPERPLPRDVPTPKVSAGGDISGRVLDEFRKARGVAPDLKPRFDLAVTVAEDARPERVLLLGRDLLVFGPGFRGGARYEYLSLDQFESDSDIQDMTARDLNGDGNAEIVVRGTRRIQNSGEKVESDGIFVYGVEERGLRRIFAIETGRSQGKNRIQGMVQFIPAKSGRGFDIDVRPGVAKGWTEKTYPWPEDAVGSSIEPLLLPWGKTKNRSYSWNGSKFAP